MKIEFEMYNKLYKKGIQLKNPFLLYSKLSAKYVKVLKCVTFLLKNIKV